MKNIYKTLICILLAYATSATAQSYCLKFRPTRVGNFLDVQLILVATNVPFRLGASNLQFRYHSTVLKSPILLSENLSATGLYNGISVTTPTPISFAGTTDKLVSLNFNFSGTTNQGLLINTGSGTDIGVIRFQISNISLSLGSPNLRPYNNGTTGTIVYNDNTNLPVWLTMESSCGAFTDPIPVRNVVSSVLPRRGSESPSGEQQNIVRWETNNDIESSTFEVATSVDNKSFRTIATIKSVGSMQYEWIDESPFHDNNQTFYRVRQLNPDGTEILSEVMQISFEKSLKLDVYPTLATTQITVINKGYENKMYKILNFMGQIVMQGTLNTPIQQINITTLANGNYIIVIDDSKNTFVKQ